MLGQPYVPLRNALTACILVQILVAGLLKDTHQVHAQMQMQMQRVGHG